MSEQLDSPTAIDPATELATLKRVNTELLQKSRDRKAKIAEMEVAAISLQAKVDAATALATDATVGIPLRRLADEMSATPGLWLDTFRKHFALKSTDGVLKVQTLAGEPVRTAKGEELRFDRADIAKHLTESEPESERTKIFRAITSTSRASGGIETKRQGGSSGRVPTPGHQFGLR